MYFFLSGIAIFQSCLKEADLPALNTSDIREIKSRSALFGGSVTDDGGAVVDLCGVCWGTATNPTIDDYKKYCKNRKNTGNFDCIISGLIPSTYYHVRAFAMNRTGIAYGNEVHFTTDPIVTPAITTTIMISSISWTRAMAGGNIMYDGGAPIIEKGICWALKKNPTTLDNKIPSNADTGNFTCNIFPLQPETVYHVRAYASNFARTAYGEDITFNSRYIPVVTTAAVTELTQTSVRTGGNVGWSNGSNVIEKGICYGTAPYPAIEGKHIREEVQSLPGFGKFTCHLTKLNSGTHYYVRAYAKILWLGNGEEITVYGKDITFTPTSNKKIH
jgi:hypothetical protein